MPAFLSKESRDLIQRMLTVDPSKRITLEEIKVHPWLSMETTPSVPIVSLNHATFGKAKANVVVLIGFELKVIIPFSVFFSLLSDAGANIDEEVVKSLHSLGLGPVDAVTKALKDQK